MKNLLDDASLPTDIPGLERELAELDLRIAGCREEITRLMDSEDPLRGIFHAAAIHEAKQLHMMLKYQKELRTARINQLRMA